MPKPPSTLMSSAVHSRPLLAAVVAAALVEAAAAVVVVRGWAAPAWPVKYGGCDWSLTQHYIFGREC
ncbi:hypothetical protein, partial [Nocardia sp. NPDC050789]|uniref:hypothetical protein n=1 Tax=Nocardia sp. NPDC050789 TaxID=3154841 RepID=UPI0033F6E2D9